MPVRYLYKKQPAILTQLIIWINVIVFLMWTFAGPYLPPNFMDENFLVSWNALRDGRYWVLVTSVFSHNMFLHLFINMFVLSSFGAVIEISLKRTRMFCFYMLAGIIGSLSHAMTSSFLLDLPELKALGASGAVAGIILLFSLIFPKEKLLLLAIIPIPAIWGALMFIGLDLWGLYSQTQGGGLPIGHGAHLGGAFTGVLYYLWLRYLRTKPRK